MIRLSDDAILALDPRSEAGRVRAAIEERLVRAGPVEPVLRALAAADRVSVAELLVGPRARVDPSMTRAALAVVDVLEPTISPSALYRRLADLAGEANMEVLAMAVSRHPDAEWLTKLSARIEGPWAGLTHLRASAHRASFDRVCGAYARLGARLALVEVGGETGSGAPLAALVRVNDRDGVIACLVALLDHQPDVPAVPLLAAVWGPELDPVLSEAVPLMGSTVGLRALAQQGRAYPAMSALVGARLGREG
jgi:hypothetical protein